MAKTMKAAGARNFGKPLAIDPTEFDFARRLEASVAVNALKDDPATVARRETGGGQSAPAPAVSRKAFAPAIGIAGRGGAAAPNGLSPGDLPLDTRGRTLNGIALGGSIAGARLDLEGSLGFAARGWVKATVSEARTHDIFTRMRKARIEGCVVLDRAA